MTLSLEVVRGPAAAALALRTVAAPAEPQCIAEQRIVEEEPIEEVWLIAGQRFEEERSFEEEQLSVVAIMAAAIMAEATVIQTINIAEGALITAVEFIEAALS